MPVRVAAHAVDERRRELDQALVELPLAEVGRAHPGRLEELVGEEEVAAVVGRQARRIRRARGPPPASAGRPSPARPAGSSSVRAGGRAVGHQSSSISGSPPAEPVAQLVPPLDVAFAEPPAQPDLAAADERREVDEAGLDLAEGDAELVDPGDARLHLVDHALHPEAEAAALGGEIARCGRPCRRASSRARSGGRTRRAGRSAGCARRGASRGSSAARDRLVGFVEIEEPGHRGNSIRGAATGPRRRAILAATMRSILLWMARNQWLRERIPKLWFARRAVRRFMPGEDVESALAAARGFAAEGIAVMFTRLGENVTRIEEADGVAEHYLGLLDTIAERGLDGEVSVKLTQLGYDIDRERTLDHVGRLAERAAATAGPAGSTWRAATTSRATIELYERLHAAHPNTGLCLQAYLHRTAADIQRLLPPIRPIRLVKGAYAEPASIAYQKRQEVDANYVALAVAMLEGVRAGRTVTIGLGTHDVAARSSRSPSMRSRSGLDRTAFEVEMLYGIRSGEQRRLAKRGLPRPRPDRVRRGVVPVVHAPPRRAARQRHSSPCASCCPDAEPARAAFADLRCTEVGTSAWSATDPRSRPLSG